MRNVDLCYLSMIHKFNFTSQNNLSIEEVVIFYTDILIENVALWCFFFSNKLCTIECIFFLPRVLVTKGHSLELQNQ